MSIVSQIALSLDLLAQNVQRLQEQAAILPPEGDIKTVEGAAEEAAQARYVNALKYVAGAVAAKTEVVRMYIEQNAESLQKAADALLTTDGDTSLEARQAAAFIEAAAEANPTSGTTSSSSPQPPATGTGSGAAKAW
ncbi:hypothetical protein [Microbacterium binotii]|uniref:hypothetical protein n=1 Tax=Microbacterium binotii TaxID=462710 RepID=UPI001F47DA35|nr:hypothetical protein [Microbacterium binotii]UIN30309.1 hypothetical protein LXM64_14385 [Microbacterium binotii]